MMNPDQEIHLNLVTQVLDQTDDLMLVMDLASQFVYANQTTADLFGYKKPDQMLFFNAHSMRCPAVESAEQFIAQDQEVIKSRRPLNLLDIHTYADGSPKILLTKKSPLYDPSGTLFGLLCHCREITTHTFQQLSMSIASADQTFHRGKTGAERSYQISHTDAQLSKRELECLFFLLRGKTMQQIAALLYLSTRTVENHVANIKHKLKCRKKSELIEYGISQGYLNIIPESLLRKDLSLALNKH